MKTEEYFESHYEFAMYIHFLFTHSQLCDFEIDINPVNYEEDWDYNKNPYEINLFFSLSGTNNRPFENLDWYEHPSELLNIQYFNPDNFTYQNELFNFEQFNTYLINKFPFLKKQDFLIYLKDHLTKESEFVSFFRFHSYSFIDNLIQFLGNGVKQYKLHNKLKTELSNQVIESKKEKI